MVSQSELQTFLRAHMTAWQFAAKASDDYLLARLGIHSALWSGFEMATQAIEKLLKSYLLFMEERFAGDQKNLWAAIVRRQKADGLPINPHDVTTYLALAADAGFAGSTELRRRVARINDYYLRRYPDDGIPGSSKSIGTDEIVDVDSAVFEIWDQFRGIHVDYYYACGVMLPVYVYYVDTIMNGHSRPPSTEFTVMTRANRAFTSRQADIDRGIRSHIHSRLG